jgi:putative mRNA 3-end processing factor
MNLIEFTDSGLFCALGNFYIDPWKPVERAVITHAHSDHARPGNGSYLCHRLTRPILDLRLGPITCQELEWGEIINMNGVKVSLYPAGHIIGSSQVKLEYNGMVWVVSGDYKTEDDGISGTFEPIKCHCFITESTFALPIYNWKPQTEIFYDIQNWILKTHDAGKIPVLIAYSLGKAQRLMQCLPAVTNDVFVHGAIWNTHQAFLQAGIKLPPVKYVSPETGRDEFRGGVVIAPPGAERSPWMKRFGSHETGICSGWMQVRGNVRRSNADAGFPMSDHADWNGLLQAVKSTGAEKVYVTHGFQSALSRYLNEQGIEAAEVSTAYGEEEEKDAVEEEVDSR